MKKKKAIIVALLIVAIVVWAASLALADGGAASSTIVQPITLSDLGVSDTGLLPSNPFYFSEEWMRGLQKIFTTGPLAKSTLEVQILNDKAAELLMVSQISPVDTDALSDAVVNYGNELKVADADLQLLNTKNKDVDSMLSDLTNKLFMHYQILEGVKAEYGDSSGQIGSAQSEIYKIMDEIPNYMSDNGQFGSVLNNTITSQTNDLGMELRSLPFLDELEYVNSNTSLNAQLDQVKQYQVFGFEGRYNADGLPPSVIPGILGQLPTDDLGKVQMVGDLRDFALGDSLKSELDSVTSTLITQAINGGEISASDVSNAINYAGALISQVGNGQKANDKDVLAANALLSEAKTGLANNSYDTALTEASAAASIADNILFNSEESSINSKDNLSTLSDKLSALVGNAAGQGLVSSDDPKLFTLFDNATSTLSNKPSISDVYQVEEYIDEINFALNNAQSGASSALIPVPGKASVQNAAGASSVITVSSGVPQYCSEVYQPVCGSDGITYSNKCFEGLANVSAGYKGECKPINTSTAVIIQSSSTTSTKGSN